MGRTSVINMDTTNGVASLTCSGLGITIQYTKATDLVELSSRASVISLDADTYVETMSGLRVWMERVVEVLAPDHMGWIDYYMTYQSYADSGNKVISGQVGVSGVFSAEYLHQGARSKPEFRLAPSPAMTITWVGLEAYLTSHETLLYGIVPKGKKP